MDCKRPSPCIDLFSRLGERLAGFGNDSRTAGIIAEAVAANPWFLVKDIRYAVGTLCEDMLARSVLTRWLEQYGQPCPLKAKKVAIIMAGNIPLVGFADLLYVLTAGHIPYVKPSSKDSVLMRHVISELRSISPETDIREYDDSGDYDAVIATGSDNSSRYFRNRFDNVPALIRGSRGSVAVLSGTETQQELGLLKEDIFSYSGLGCRNVSMIFVPETYDIAPLVRTVAPAADEVNPKYYNNYRRTKGEFAAAGIGYTDGGTFVMTEGDAFPVSLSNIILCRYKEMNEVQRWIAVHEERLQCIVSACTCHPRCVPFGRAQHPAPWDYPDGLDVMEFLAGE